MCQREGLLLRLSRTVHDYDSTCSLSGVQTKGYEPIWVSPPGLFGDDLDAVVLRSERHLAALWMAPFPSGVWEAFALEVLPPSEVVDSPLRDTWMVGQWLGPRSELLANLPREHPLTQNAVRGVPVQEAFAFRTSVRLTRALDEPPRWLVRLDQLKSLTRADRTDVRMLLDALDYTTARRLGVSPLVLIASRRAISQEAAMQRVNRARRRGLLAKEKAGGLTEEAEQLLARLREQDLDEREDG